jgi:hypothetical protein
MSFKRAFGADASKGTLKHLLNSVMRGPDGSFEIADIENVEVKDAVLRSVMFDVRCKLTSGKGVIVELQNAQMRRDIVDRLVEYQASDYAQQWLRGGKPSPEKGVYTLVPVRVLALLDFCVDKDPARCGTLVQHYHMQHDTTDARQVPAPVVAERLEALTDITIVQLPLAPTTLEVGMTDAQKWAHLLRSSQTYTYETLPEPLRTSPFLAAASSARYDKTTAAERRTLDEHEDAAFEFEGNYAARTAAEAKASAAEAKASAAEARASDEAAARAAAEARAADGAAARAAAEAKTSAAEVELAALKAMLGLRAAEGK